MFKRIGRNAVPAALTLLLKRGSDALFSEVSSGTQISRQGQHDYLISDGTHT
jgi:hypothetical protein